MRKWAWIAMIVAPMAAWAGALEDAEKAFDNAAALRAEDFAPNHFAEAKAKLAAAKAASEPEQAALADEAAEIAQRFSEAFADLIEARDKMELIGAADYRPDLVERANGLFRATAAAFEEGYPEKARRQAKLARDTIHAAQVVAAREKFLKPVTKLISEARRYKAREFAPQAFGEALKTSKALEKLVRNDPENQSQAHALSEKGRIWAERALRIAKLGSAFAHDHAEVERWVEAEDARLNLIAKALGLAAFAKDADAEAMVAAIRVQLEAMRQGYEAQLADADAEIQRLQKQLADAQQRLAQYEGTVAEMQAQFAEMEELRRKLRIKREAEAKIKQLAALFKPDEAEVLLTPEADVILRIKGLHFRSGSAVIPPEGYALLDKALKALQVFPNRRVRVEGHTDSIGDADYNQKLSERRAEAVRQYLLERLESPREIKAVGYGESRPIANNETAEGRRKNRRIDIVLPAPGR
ncbi:MAG: hypothetical protein D6771_09115 [Zetaproteobacteria bacterium]|nr:MAG: hypothetical protein D6771_09115 [Zetaproteobacteria bacterium]